MHLLKSSGRYCGVGTLSVVVNDFSCRSLDCFFFCLSRRPIRSLLAAAHIFHNVGCHVPAVRPTTERAVSPLSRQKRPQFPSVVGCTTTVHKSCDGLQQHQQQSATVLVREGQNLVQGKMRRSRKQRAGCKLPGVLASLPWPCPASGRTALSCRLSRATSNAVLPFPVFCT